MFPGACKKCFFVVGVLIAGMVLLQGAAAADGDHDGLDDALEMQLAEQYAPIFYFEKEEQVFPVAVEYHLANANLNRSDEGTPHLLVVNPSPEQLGAYTSIGQNYYLDNTVGTIEDRRIIEDYREYAEQHGYTVYSHVFPSGAETVIQYWCFYAFNEGPLNTHEGDWEMVQIVLDANGTAREAMYSQHLSGQRAPWSDVKKSGDHPHVFVARGSHANYFRHYQGMTGLASDRVGKNGMVLEPGQYTLALLGERSAGNHPAGQNWLDFAGRWGDFGSDQDEVRGKRGPPGPAYREDGEMWAGTDWGRSLPGVSSLMLSLDWIFYHFTYIFLAFLGVAVVAAGVAIYRRHGAAGLKWPYTSLLMLYRPNLRSLANILAVAGIVLAVLSLFYPWYTMGIDIDGGSFQTPGLVEVLRIDGMNGLQVNLLEENSGLVQIGAVPVAFSLLVGAGILLFVLGTIGATPDQAGKKYLGRGIRFWVPVVVILAAVVMVKTLAFQLAESGASEAAVAGARDLLGTAAGQPWGGQTTATLEAYGSAYLEWGLGLGAYLLIAAGILLVAGGLLSMRAGKTEDTGEG